MGVQACGHERPLAFPVRSTSPEAGTHCNSNWSYSRSNACRKADSVAEPSCLAAALTIACRRRGLARSSRSPRSQSSTRRCPCCRWCRQGKSPRKSSWKAPAGLCAADGGARGTHASARCERKAAGGPQRLRLQRPAPAADATSRAATSAIRPMPLRLRAMSVQRGPARPLAGRGEFTPAPLSLPSGTGPGRSSRRPCGYFFTRLR